MINRCIKKPELICRRVTSTSISTTFPIFFITFFVYVQLLNSLHELSILVLRILLVMNYAFVTMYMEYAIVTVQ